ncbi:lipid-A-disaccharide synthase [Chitinispirillales bacterium ANBcel5]|uniref:lipid-A-disaccharide synthase n=1 Tax=Cellulosispirillum alkaliphilum TaxID=3039283 RepID=UPI002A577948|nr:lipid-A-disaccharide synthase [Chitinispirillales bacterium ANBcel5]
MASPRSIAFIAGDPSGDLHCAPVIKELLKRSEGLKTWGIGGPNMQREGFEPLFPFAPFNKMGFVEVAKHIGFFLKAKRQMVNALKQRRPDVLVCVDYPGFNMPVMKEAKKLNIPVLYFIAPMVWAWKKKRAKTLGTQASHIAVIFPFEVNFFKQYKAPVSFVGNPLIEANAEEGYSLTSPKTAPTADQPLRLAIVPGSRSQEVSKMLNPMIKAALIVKKQYPQTIITVSKCPGLHDSHFSSVSEIDTIELFSGPLRQQLSQSDLALVTSGTASLECALLGVPMVVAYRTSTLNYHILKSLITIPHIGLPNIIAGREIVPECIQNETEPEKMASKILKLVKKPSIYYNCASELYKLNNILGEKKPSTTVAEIIESLGYG